MSDSLYTQLPLAPLGAGDLIDRAVRLYRRHLFVLIRTAAPPVIIVAAGWVLLSISVQQIFRTFDTPEMFAHVVLLMVAFAIMLTGYLFILIVMGGATRTLVAHLLRNEPVTARATYRAVRARFWALFAASLVVLMWVFASLSVAFVGWEMVAGILFIGSAFISIATAPWVGAIVAVIGVLIATALSVWLFFFIVGRVVYVPQVMLVEGKGVFESIGRSFTLAQGNVRRLMAMTLFTTVGTLSAVMLLAFIISMIGGLSGIRSAAEMPAWYAISSSMLGPLSSILVTPVWMLGLSLLYLDERVRHEGYDIELMAARQLGELPDINVSSPFGTALHERKQPPPMPRSTGSVLNLS